MKTKTNILKDRVQARGTLVKAVLAAVLMCSALFSAASSLPRTTPQKAETEKTIQNYFRFPQLLIPHANRGLGQQKVEVLFTTGRDGRVNFALAKTSDDLLKQEVEKQFYNLKLPRLTSNVVHSVVLNFKRQ